jgi:hypothetical protein
LSTGRAWRRSWQSIRREAHAPGAAHESAPGVTRAGFPGDDSFFADAERRGSAEENPGGNPANRVKPLDAGRYGVT